MPTPPTRTRSRSSSPRRRRWRVIYAGRMTLPAADTVVTYADGLSAEILDRTAFHLVDPVWHDQPADTGTLTVDGRTVPVVGAVVGATDGTTLHVGDAPVRTGTDGWSFVVCHLVEEATGVEP